LLLVQLLKGSQPSAAGDEDGFCRLA